jgi:hypothetical protein
MYAFILALHSLTRWFVLASLLFALYRAYSGWLSGKTYSKFDDRVRSITVNIANIQFTIGLWLYFISPITNYFISHFKEAVHNRQIRFFGMEHITMMLIGIALISIASSKAKRKTTDKEKFKTLAIWLTIALLVILSSIPWSFSPLISRPLFRPF